MLTDSKTASKRRIRRYMMNKALPLTPEIVVNKIYRKMTIYEAEDLLYELADNDNKISRTEADDGLGVYFYKYKRKRKYY
jgi:hypothetical protein